IDVQIEGRDVDASFGIARQLFAGMRKVPGTEDVRIGQVFNHPALRLDVDRQLASQLNIGFRDVASSVLTSLSSSSLTSPNFWVNRKNGVNYIVAVQTPTVRMASPDDLLATPLTPGPGASQTSTIANQPTVTPGPLALIGSDLAVPPANAPYLGGLARLVPTQ